MKHHATNFDHCQTQDAIHAQLQAHLHELLSLLQPGAAHLEDNQTANLLLLSELSYADLKQCEKPVFLLSEISRLLLKSGESALLAHALAISHVIYAFKCRQNESWYISSLYKGIAQIGRRATDLGIKNVFIGMGDHHEFQLTAVDRALGYWASMSAALANRNLRMALAFAQKWRGAAQEGNLRGEICRANAALALLHLLNGDAEADACAAFFSASAANTPQEWREMVAFLADWFNALAADRCPEMREVAEPLPLFLGARWQGDAPDDFAQLCKIRRRFCHAQRRKSLSDEEICQCADVMAAWELPRPLSEFEADMQARSQDRYAQSRLTRLMGKHALQKILSETPLTSRLATPEKAVIWVMDVRKFSALSETLSPPEVFDLLNPVFKIISAELEPIGGEILEFIGDSLVIVFETFENQHSDMSAILRHTIHCLRRIYVLNALSARAARQDVRIGVGIHAGPVALGYLGGLQRCHLTVLGNTINLAARLESASKELPGDVMVSAACFDNRPPNVWREPQSVNFSLRDVGCHAMRNIAQPVRLFGLKPLLPYWVDFVPMGFVASPERGVVYLDTGNAAQPGIIDHHFEQRRADSACESLVKHPDLLLEHVKGLPPSQIEFRLHAQPDFDCVAALYAAHELLANQPRHDLLRRLAEYASKVDRACLPHPEWLNVSVYGVFRAHQLLASRHHGAACDDLRRVEYGLRVIDAAMFLMEARPQDGDLASIFQFEPDWFTEERELLERDLATYHEDVALRSHTYAARVNGLPEPVLGIWLDHPRSLFFRVWGWNDPNAPGGRGYPFLAIDFSMPGKNRFVIGVSPESGTNVNGLGQLLERHETEKRERLGKQRPIQPIRYPADNSDPWYFGQGHNYALVDSPGQGTILTAEETQQIHEHWQNNRAWDADR